MDDLSIQLEIHTQTVYLQEDTRWIQKRAFGAEVEGLADKIWENNAYIEDGVWKELAKRLLRKMEDKHSSWCVSGAKERQYFLRTPGSKTI